MRKGVLEKNNAKIIGTPRFSGIFLLTKGTRSRAPNHRRFGDLTPPSIESFRYECLPPAYLIRRDIRTARCGILRFRVKSRTYDKVSVCFFTDGNKSPHVGGTPGKKEEKKHRGKNGRHGNGATQPTQRRQQRRRRTGERVNDVAGRFC